MSDLGLELLKLVDERSLNVQENDERTRKQLIRFSKRLEKARTRLGKNLEMLAKDLRRRIRRKGLPSMLLRIFLPWRHYADKRQLELVDVLLAWHAAESKEMILAIDALKMSYDVGGSDEKQTK